MGEWARRVDSAWRLLASRVTILVRGNSAELIMTVTRNGFSPAAGRRKDTTMSETFLGVLTQHETPKDPDRSKEISLALDEACRRLAEILAACSTTAELRQDLLAQVPHRVQTLLEEIESQADGRQMGPPSVQPTPEILEWARQQFSEEEIVAGLREIRETGGLQLRDFIHELE